jgi:hypothetical protein
VTDENGNPVDLRLDDNIFFNVTEKTLIGGLGEFTLGKHEIAYISYLPAGAYAVTEMNGDRWTAYAVDSNPSEMGQTAQVTLAQDQASHISYMNLIMPTPPTTEPNTPTPVAPTPYPYIPMSNEPPAVPPTTSPPTTETPPTPITPVTPENPAPSEPSDSTPPDEPSSDTPPPDSYDSLGTGGSPMASAGVPKTGGPPPAPMLNGLFLPGLYSIAAGVMYRRKYWRNFNKKRNQ